MTLWRAGIDCRAKFREHERPYVALFRDKGPANLCILLPLDMNNFTSRPPVDPSVVQIVHAISHPVPHESRHLQGVKKFTGAMLSPHAPLFMLIHVCHMISNDYVTETMIMNFLKYRGIKKFLRWAAVEDLRIHRIHHFIIEEEMNK
jgi:hypothetical protein